MGARGIGWVVLGISVVLVIPFGFILALVPQLLIRVTVHNDPQTWCVEHAPESIEFPSGPSLQTTWSVRPAGIDCISQFEPFTASFDMGSGILIAGVTLIALGLLSGVVAAAMIIIASRGARRAAGLLD